jgi:ribosome-associated toxin RatA of RatAB toxin-antitoxin module
VWVRALRILGAWSLFALGLSLGADPVVAAADREDQLTLTERKQLNSGELVQRPVRETRGKLDLMGGTSWQVIDAPPERVWRALLDVKRYPRMLPRVIEARLVKRKGDTRLIFVRQGAAFVETTYHLKVSVNRKQRDMTFALDDKRPHRVRAAWGFFSVRPYGKARTLLTFGIMADPGEGLIAAMMRGIVHEWMLKSPWMIKRFVEGSGQWIYK